MTNDFSPLKFPGIMAGCYLIDQKWLAAMCLNKDNAFFLHLTNNVTIIVIDFT